MEHSGPTSWLLKLPFLPDLLREQRHIHVTGGLVVLTIITVFSLLAYFLLRGREQEYLVPKKKMGIVTFFDMLVEGLYRFICTIIPHDAERHVPFIGAMFIFIFVSNLLGLLPMSSSPSASTNTTIALGVLSFLYYNYAGIRAHGLAGYGKHFLMGLGIFGLPIALLEMISHVIRPASLGIRLYANLFIDHMLVGAIQDMFAWILPVPLLLFGLFVCTLQAFIFATLSAVYIAMATEH